MHVCILGASVDSCVLLGSFLGETRAHEQWNRNLMHVLDRSHGCLLSDTLQLPREGEPMKPCSRCVEDILKDGGNASRKSVESYVILWTAALCYKHCSHSYLVEGFIFPSLSNSRIFEKEANHYSDCLSVYVQMLQFLQKEHGETQRESLVTITDSFHNF